MSEELEKEVLGCFLKVLMYCFTPFVYEEKGYHTIHGLMLLKTVVFDWVPSKKGNTLFSL